jgi:hypothetical protein
MGTVKLDEKVESLPEPGVADTSTAEEVGIPHLGEGIQGISEERGRRVASDLALSLIVEALLLEMELLLLLLVPAFEVAEKVLVKAPNQGSEIAPSVLDIVAVDLSLKSLLSTMKDLEGIPTEGVDEFLSRTGESVEVVDVSEQEPGTSVDGAGLLSMLASAPVELVELD